MGAMVGTNNRLHWGLLWMVHTPFAMSISHFGIAFVVVYIVSIFSMWNPINHNPPPSLFVLIVVLPLWSNVNLNMFFMCRKKLLVLGSWVSYVIFWDILWTAESAGIYILKCLVLHKSNAFIWDYMEQYNIVSSHSSWPLVYVVWVLWLLVCV